MYKLLCLFAALAVACAAPAPEPNPEAAFIAHPPTLTYAYRPPYSALTYPAYGGALAIGAPYAPYAAYPAAYPATYPAAYTYNKVF